MGVYLEIFSKYLKSGKIFSIFLIGVWYFLCKKNEIGNNLRYNLAIFDLKKINEFYSIKTNEVLLQIDLKDKGISQDLFLYGNREPYSTEFFKNDIQNNDNIVDIGANIGYYAILESIIAENGKIYAIEPIPKSMQILRKNSELNKRINIEFFTMGIGREDGELSINIYDKSNYASFTNNPHTKVISTHKVQMMRLDKFLSTFVKTSPTYIRMDVEGFETEIIGGMQNLLESFQPFKLFIEIHPFLITHEDLIAMIDTLKNNGFKIRAIFNEPAARDLHSLKNISKIHKKLDIPTFGFVGNDYKDLEHAVNQWPYKAYNVFFERK